MQLKTVSGLILHAALKELLYQRSKKALRTHIASMPKLHSTSSKTSIERPGCTIADETLTVKGHLEGLAQGLGGFGVLRTSYKRMGKAIRAAKQMQNKEITKKLEHIQTKLTKVHTPEKAKVLEGQFAALVPTAWELGRRCSSKPGQLHPKVLAAAGRLAKEVNSGRMKKDEAILHLANLHSKLQGR